MKLQSDAHLYRPFASACRPLPALGRAHDQEHIQKRLSRRLQKGRSHGDLNLPRAETRHGRYLPRNYPQFTESLSSSGEHWSSMQRLERVSRTLLIATPYRPRHCRLGFPTSVAIAFASRRQSAAFPDPAGDAEVCPIRSRRRRERFFASDR
jgi:hypothetical protein